MYLHIHISHGMVGCCVRVPLYTSFVRVRAELEVARRERERELTCSGSMQMIFGGNHSYIYIYIYTYMFSNISSTLSCIEPQPRVNTDTTHNIQHTVHNTHTKPPQTNTHTLTENRHHTHAHSHSCKPM